MRVDGEMPWRQADGRWAGRATSWLVQLTSSGSRDSWGKESDLCSWEVTCGESTHVCSHPHSTSSIFQSLCGVELETVSMASLGPCAGFLLQTWNCLQRV